MNRFLIIFLMLPILYLTSCDSKSKDSNRIDPDKEIKELYEISGNTVVIKDINGADGIAYNGRAALEESIYNDLKGKSGVYNVIMYEKKFNYYGYEETIECGRTSINVDELNKFAKYRNWKGRTGGIRGLNDW